MEQINLRYAVKKRIFSKASESKDDEEKERQKS